MSIYEYDREAHIRMEREDAFEEGRESAFEEGRIEERRVLLTEMIQKKFTKGKTIEQIADELEKEVSEIEEIIKRYSVI